MQTTKGIRFITLLITTVSSVGFSQAQSIPGLPEPGYIMYGAVTNTNGNRPISNEGLIWNVSLAGSATTNTATFISVNGQIFYMVRIPFETRRIDHHQVPCPFEVHP